MEFSVTNLLGEVYTEVVEDCHTILDFVNRHFGSIDPDECGLTVAIVKLAEVAEEIDEAVDTPAVTPAPAVENAVDNVSATPENVVKAL